MFYKTVSIIVFNVVKNIHFLNDDYLNELEKTKTNSVKHKDLKLERRNRLLRETEMVYIPFNLDKKSDKITCR